MKKYSLFVVCLLASTIILSACSVEQKSTIKYERKLGKYFDAEQKPAGVIDLSEGPKLKYDANLGPKDLNFDIKIINPY